MEKFKWLKDYREKENQLAYLELKLEIDKKELERWVSGDLCDIKLTPESNGAQLEEIIEKTEREIANKMNDLHDIKQLVSTFKGIDHQIIIGKYVEGKTLEQIAEDIKYSASYVKRRHAEIARAIRYIESFNSIREYN